MEFQDGIPVPVILNSVRPGRQRPRLASEHVNRQPAYYQDANGMLIPASSMGAPLGRSTSQGHHRPASVVMINNSNYEDRSPSASPQRSSRHRHSHGHEGRYDDSDSFDERERTSRHHSKHHHKRYEKSKSRSPSPYYDYEYEEKMKRLELYDRQAEEEEAKERFKEQQLIEKAKKEEKKKEEEKMKEKAVEEWKIKKLEKEAKERKEKEEADREFTERVKETFGKAGYSEESIEKILQNGDKKELGQQIMDLKRPTYIKVRREHLSPETLDVYDLPWEYDRVSLCSSFLKNIMQPLPKML